MKVRYLNAPAGSGKSFQAISTHAVRMALDGERVLVAMPTKELIGQAMADLGGYGVQAEQIVANAETAAGERSVVSRLVRTLRQPDSSGQIVLITHEGLKMLQYSGQLDWHLIIDEALQVHASFDPIIDEDVMTLANACSRTSCPWSGLTEFTLSKDPRQTIEFPEKVSERTQVHKLAWTLSAKHTNVYVPDSSIAALHSSDPGNRKFIAFSMVRPKLVEPFKSVLILSANFENSLIHNLWSIIGVKFVEDTELASCLRFREHDGSRATILYVMDRPWSSAKQGRLFTDNDELTVHDAIVRKVSEHFGNMPFLWVANAVHKNNLFPSNPNAQRLPNVSHGLNHFQDFTNVVFLPALNPSPVELAYFKKLGLTEEQVKTGRFYESAYQSVMRCSLRSQNDTRPVQIIVVDRATADHLHQLLPGSSINKLGWLNDEQSTQKKPGRPQKHSSNAEKQAAYRSRKNALSDHESFVADSNKIILDDSGYCSSRYENYINTNIENVTNVFWGSQFQSRTAKIATHLFLCDSVNDFVAQLKEMSLEKVGGKEDRYLISPAYFNPREGVETQKGKQNIEFLRGIWLDNDGGGIPPEAVSNLFPELQMAIFNSYNSTKANPRYRVFIPTTTVFGPQTHDTVINEIWSRFHRAGYEADTLDQCEDGRRFHGFDRSKKPAASLFYLPSQAADPYGNIFLEFDDGHRKPLEPKDWIRKYHRGPEILTEKVLGDQVDPSVDWAKVEATKVAWRNSPKTPGSGNGNFFKLGLKLQLAGLSWAEIEVHLRQEAIFARNPMERHRQIPSIISSLKIYTMDQKTRKAA
ncbi:hypothetical protein NKI95_32095 [Mesorhizobium sp. M0306]|uniref:DEAD/DEAH box helicase n=1 Tax=Mesorhizobium sp. M0306 TaxID=2956932 RepID=UPI0033354A11